MLGAVVRPDRLAMFRPKGRGWYLGNHLLFHVKQVAMC